MPDLTISADTALPALLRGELSRAEAERSDAIQLARHTRLLAPFTAMSRLD